MKSIRIRIAGVLLAVAFVYSQVSLVKAEPAGDKVRLGIDNIDYYQDIFSNKRIGLITNKTGVDSKLTSSIDVLKAKTNLVKLFAPEHGIRGDASAGSTVKDDYDAKSGLKVYSLYGNTNKPTTDMLKDIDILAYDIQDVGARFYTYISTMAYAMQSCAENQKTFVVFDRPNPIGGEAVQGSILDNSLASFVGVYPIIQRYGLTVGETAQLFNKVYGINCKLVVIPMSNWTRNMYYEDTGLNTWVAPSPNIPSITTAVAYSGTCIFEGTNVSEGRGTSKPFQYIGAPYINGNDLAGKMNSLGLQGVNYQPVNFTPTTSKYSASDNTFNNTGTAINCGGVNITITDRAAFQSVKAAVALLYTIRDMYPDNFKYTSDNYIDKLTGNSYIRQGNYSLKEVFSLMDNDAAEFKRIEAPYYLYGSLPQDPTVGRAANIRAESTANKPALQLQSGSVMSEENKQPEKSTQTSSDVEDKGEADSKTVEKAASISSPASQEQKPETGNPEVLTNENAKEKKANLGLYIIPGLLVVVLVVAIFQKRASNN